MPLLQTDPLLASGGHEVMKEPTTQARIKRDLIIETWKRLGCPSVGVETLREIQRAVSERFGAGAIDSPASIARVLADEDAELRHPEVIEFDTVWRESKFNEDTSKQINKADPTKPLTLKRSAAMLRRLEKLRKKLAHENNTEELRRLRDLAINEKARAQLLARDHALRDQTRSAQAEIAEWFRVWLQTPHLFADWLELRRRSREFRETFPRE